MSGFVGLCPGEDQGDLEQVAVHQDLKLTLLQLHQALGDVQTQAAAFGIPGGVPPDEPLHQFVGVDVQLFPGDILHGDDDLAVHFYQVDIDPGAGQGIFHVPTWN